MLAQLTNQQATLIAGVLACAICVFIAYNFVAVFFGSKRYKKPNWDFIDTGFRVETTKTTYTPPVTPTPIKRPLQVESSKTWIDPRKEEKILRLLEERGASEERSKSAIKALKKTVLILEEQVKKLSTEVAKAGKSPLKKSSGKKRKIVHDHQKEALMKECCQLLIGIGHSNKEAITEVDNYFKTNSPANVDSFIQGYFKKKTC